MLVHREEKVEQLTLATRHLAREARQKRAAEARHEIGRVIVASVERDAGKTGEAGESGERDARPLAAHAIRLDAQSSQFALRHLGRRACETRTEDVPGHRGREVRGGA